MHNRTTDTRVTFFRPFKLAGMDRAHPAGSYVIETDEEQLEGVSFPAYRRTETYIVLPGLAGGAIRSETVKISAEELKAALGAKLETASIAETSTGGPELTVQKLLDTATVQTALSSASEDSLRHLRHWEHRRRFLAPADMAEALERWEWEGGA